LEEFQIYSPKVIFVVVVAAQQQKNPENQQWDKKDDVLVQYLHHLQLQLLMLTMLLSSCLYPDWQVSKVLQADRQIAWPHSQLKPSGWLPGSKLENAISAQLKEEEEAEDSPLP
jgi:hypothetical protein